MEYRFTGIRRRIGPRGEILLLRLLVLGLSLIAWEGVVALRIMDAFWISSPVRIITRASELVSKAGFYEDVWTTLVEMILGVAAGAFLGVSAGMILARFELLHKAVDPFMMVIYSMPRLALAPLFILWLGIGLASKVVLSMFVAFFIIEVNTYAGFRSVDEDLVNAIRTTGASENYVTRRVRFPSAVPWILSGVRLGVGSALPAAIVAEMLASTKGIGHEIARAAGVFDTTGLFTYLAVLALFATILNEGLKVLENRLLSWRSGNEQI